ncbi:MAG: SIS domain-containing protein [Armatimonadota bacterium]
MLARLLERYPPLGSCRAGIEAAREALERCFEGGGKLLLCGHGGSAADCEHIAGELLKGFELKRPLAEEAHRALSRQGDEGAELGAKLQRGLPAIPLTGFPSLASAFANDVDGTLVFAQLVNALGRPGDALLAISTTGAGRSIAMAAIAAKALGMVTIALTGRGGGKLRELCDIVVDAPGGTTPEVQEMHVPIYHYLCRAIEERFLSDER